MGLPSPDAAEPKRVGKTIARTLIVLVGIGAAGYLLAAHGLDQVFRALQLVGWSGLTAVTLVHAVATLLCALAWWLLLCAFSDARWSTFLWVRWLRDGLGAVVPVMPVSGELISMRMLAMRGVALADAGTVADLTAELLTQAAFAATGFVLLNRSRPHAPYQTWIVVGICAMVLQYVGFMFAQRKGLFRLIQHPFDWLTKRGRVRASSAEEDAPLHERILRVYRQHNAFYGCLALHFVAWIITGLEMWLGLWFMGQPRSVADVLILESLVYAIRASTFFIPLGAGVQEGGYVLIGGLLGIDATVALAVALLKRGRDLLIGVPALLCWQLLEAGNFRRARQAGADEAGVTAGDAVAAARNIIAAPPIAPAQVIVPADSSDG
jgi:putative membrane protein